MNEQSTTPSSESLLASVMERDEGALAAFYARHSKLIYSVSFRILRDRSFAEDVVQEVFMQVWRSPSDFIRVKGSIESWLAVIARNRAIDILRGTKPLSLSDAPPVASTQDVDAEVQDLVSRERIDRYVATLPKEQKAALELAFFHGFTRAEIALHTGQPLGTVNTRIRLAVRTIRKLVGRKPKAKD